MPRQPRDLPTRARFARVRANFENEQAAATEIGCGRTTVIRWEDNAKSISGKYLQAAARAYKVRPEWLTLESDEDGYPWSPEPIQASGAAKRGAVLPAATPAGYVRFQLLEGAGGMGTGVVNQDYPEVIRQVDMAEWEVRRKIGFMPAPGRIKLITGRGPSMRPRIDHGDVVMVDTSVKAFDGDATYVINVNGETQIKMLQMRGDGLYVVSANLDYPAYKLQNGDQLHIGGKVVATMGVREL